MIFRQLFDSTSCSYTYLIAAGRGGEALIIDPVLDKVERYLQLLDELDLRLVKALDSHLHADHITGMGALRDRTKCITVMGKESSVDVVSMRISDGDRVAIEGLGLDVIHTPGHTPGHVAVHLESGSAHAVMWGDLLHSPLQCLRPDWYFMFDTDPAQSVASRRRVLESCCEHDHLVLPAHFPAPSVGRITAEGDAFRFGYERLER